MIALYKPIVALVLVGTVASAIFTSRLSRDTLESDFSKLRNKESLETGAGFWGDKVDAVFQRYLTPTIVLTTDPKDTQKVAEELQSIQARDGAASPISDIKRVEDFLPGDQARKIRIIEQIKSRLPAKAVAQLGGEDRKLVDEFLPKETPTPLTVHDLPEGVIANFREMDGSLGHMVHVYPKLPPNLKARAGARGDGKDQAGFWDAREVIRFADRIREAVRDAGVAAAIAGQPPLSADMIEAIASDGPKATAFAFFAVVALVLILFPRWELSRWVLGALLLGVLWMGGVMGGFGLKINFLNFIALPITFGIGVDYAVNIFSRYRSDGAHSIGPVIENTGGAVALCSWTTSIGYASLLIAGSQAFVSFGTLAVLGELTCLTAAIVALPALWHALQKFKSR